MLLLYNSPGTTARALYACPFLKKPADQPCRLFLIPICYPDNPRIAAKPGQLAPGKIMDGIFQSLHHCVFARIFSPQQAADEAILQPQSLKTLVAHALRK